MMSPNGLELPLVKIAELCHRYQVRELSVFGSATRGQARPDSDIDFLVEFQPDARTGLLDYAGLMNELSEVLGRKADLVSKQGLKPLIREAVLAESQVIYAA
jgi:predicted nucleotidyltransferase